MNYKRIAALEDDNPMGLPTEYPKAVKTTKKFAEWNPEDMRVYGMGLAPKKKMVIDLPSGASGSLFDLMYNRKLTQEDFKAMEELTPEEKNRFIIEYIMDMEKDAEPKIKGYVSPRLRDITI